MIATREFSFARAPLVVLAASLLLAGCSDTPTTLRIVSGPPPTNEQLAALLVTASAEVETPVRLAPGPGVADAEAALAALVEGRADVAIVENSVSYRQPGVRTVIPLYPSVLHIGVLMPRSGERNPDSRWRRSGWEGRPWAVWRFGGLLFRTRRFNPC